MPAYNAGMYIKESIDSVLRQSYHKFELLIINDGSTDNTKSILDDYVDSRIRIIHTTNRGQSAAANLAYKYSKGDYIKFFDADDLLSEDFLKSQLQQVIGKDDVIASASWGRFYNDDIETFKLDQESVWRNMAPIDWLKESLRSGHNMMQCALWLIPRKIISTAGLWNEKLNLINDFEFFIRILLASNKILFCENAILYYRSGLSNSLSGKKTDDALNSAYISTKLGMEALIRFEDSYITRKLAANQFQHLMFQLYPVNLPLFRLCASEIKKLGKPDVKMNAGGITKIMNVLIGWKWTNLIKYYLKKEYLKYRTN